MAYASWSVTFGEQPSTTKWNILGTNDAYFDSLIGSGTAWTSYATTWTGSGSNPAIGNGTITGKYLKFGKFVKVRIKVIPGSTTTYGSGSYYFTLPQTPSTLYDATGKLEAFGFSSYIDSSAGNATYFGWSGIIYESSAYKIQGLVASTAGTSTLTSGFTPSNPFTLASGDTVVLDASYEIA